MKTDILTILALVFGLGLAASTLGVVDVLQQEEQATPLSGLHQGIVM